MILLLSFDVRRQGGIERLSLKRQLTPPWTTRWISGEGRRKLKAYGIAPPDEGALCAGRLAGDPPEIACPRCGSKTTERISQFGSTPCKATWRCRDCLEPFDYFKCI